MSEQTEKFTKAILKKDIKALRLLLSKNELNKLKEEQSYFFGSITIQAIRILISHNENHQTIIDAYEAIIDLYDEVDPLYDVLDAFLSYLDDFKMYKFLFDYIETKIQKESSHARMYFYLLFNKGKYEESISKYSLAIDTFNELLNQFDKLEDKSNLDILKIVFKTNLEIGTCHNYLNNFSLAKTYLDDAQRLNDFLFDKKKINYFDRFSLIFQTFNNDYYLKKHEEAKNLYLKENEYIKYLVKRELDTYGVFYAIMISNYAEIISLENKEKAIDLYVQSAKQYETVDKLRGKPIDSLAANCYSDAASLCINLNRYDEAISLYQKALKIYKVHEKKQLNLHPSIANLHRKMASLLLMKKNNAQVKKHYQESIKIYESLGKNSTNHLAKWAEVSVEYALLLYELDELDKASTLAYQATNFFATHFHKSYGAYADLTVKALRAYIKVERKRNVVTNLASFYETGILCYQLLYKANKTKYHDEVVEFYIDYGDYFEQELKSVEARQYYVKALDMIEAKFRNDPIKYRELTYRIISRWESSMRYIMNDEVIKMHHRFVSLIEHELKYDQSNEQLYIQKVFELSSILYNQEAYQASEKYLDKLLSKYNAMTDDDKVMFFYYKVIAAIHFDVHENINLLVEDFCDHYDMLNSKSDKDKENVNKVFNRLEKQKIELSKTNSSWFETFLETKGL
jgi:hypothetical protein